MTQHSHQTAPTQFVPTAKRTAHLTGASGLAGGYMLAHLLEQGGCHLGPYKTPTKEDDPRHMPPNFYYDQQDFLEEFQKGKRWTWSVGRPHAVCGFSSG